MTSKNDAIAIHTMQTTIIAMQTERERLLGALEAVLEKSHDPIIERIAQVAITQARQVPTHA